MKPFDNIIDLLYLAAFEIPGFVIAIPYYNRWWWFLGILIGWQFFILVIIGLARLREDRLKKEMEESE